MKKIVSLLLIIITILVALSGCNGFDNSEKDNILSQLTTGEWEYRDDSSSEKYVFSDDYTYYNEENENGIKRGGTFEIVKIASGSEAGNHTLKTINENDVEKFIGIELQDGNIISISVWGKTYTQITEEELQEREKEHQEALDKIDEENEEKSKVKVIDVTCGSTVSGDHYFTTVSGKLYNSGDKDYSYAKIEIILYGDNGVSIGRTTKTINENITSGTMIDFLRAVETNSKVTKAVAYVKILN